MKSSHSLFQQVSLAATGVNFIKDMIKDSKLATNMPSTRRPRAQDLSVLCNWCSELLGLIN